MQVQAVSGLGEHLGGLRIALGFLLGADVTELQFPLAVDAVPAVGATDTQAQRVELMPGVQPQVITVDRSRGMGTVAHAQ
ncbi:hypothetical protein D3C71_1839680 [compost metagenome]